MSTIPLNTGAHAIRAALDAALNVDALDLARKAAVERPDEAEVRYLGALASARLGALAEAERWLAHVDRDVLGSGDLAVEVWSLVGRIAKERYATAADRSSSPARDLAHAAIDGYRRAFAIGGSAYPAVNAATMAMLVGDGELALSLAQQALKSSGGADDHWRHATVGEAKLVLGDVDAARADYAEARRRAGSRFGDIASMRRQLLLIGSPDAHAMLDAVPAPRVIAFSGHVIDRP
ncbi:MAG: TRAFs-binding domain-containing protein, partial [Betaproteobacteria bacterium]